MAQTLSTALTSIVTFEIQTNVLKNLRFMLTYANADFSESTHLTPGHDVASFVFIPDLAIAATPLTEGVAPTAVAMTVSKVDVSCVQYGNLVDISDVAKNKTPVQLIAEASDRLSRNAQETIDQITRDVIAAGGTAFYAGAGTSRATLAATDKLKASDLRKLRGTMFKNKIPPMADGYYRIILSPDQGFDLRNDATATGNWVDVNKYKNPEILMAGELGRMEGFRIAEAVTAPTFASTVAVTAAVAFGAPKGWGRADLQTLSVHHVAPGGDHSDPLAQSEKIGWKVMFGAAVLANSRYYRLESATTLL